MRRVRREDWGEGEKHRVLWLSAEPWIAVTRVCGCGCGEGVHTTREAASALSSWSGARACDCTVRLDWSPALSVSVAVCAREGRC